MFNAPYQQQPYDGQEQDSFTHQVTPPPVVRVDIILGPGWNGAIGDDPQKAAQTLLNQYMGEIDSFYLQQMQNASLGSSPQWGHEIEIAGGAIRVRLSVNQNTATMTLEVRPTNGSLGDITNESGGIFTIYLPFLGYGINNHTPDIPNPWGLYNPMYFENGGVGICKDPLSGLAYFEVEIVELPIGVPPSVFYASPPPVGGDDTIVATSSDIQTTNSSGTTILFPDDLDDFYTPCIGVVPDYYVNRNNIQKNTIVYGDDMLGDDKLNSARSVYVQPSQSRYSDYSISEWDDATYYLENVTLWAGPISYLFGASANISDNPIVATVPGKFTQLPVQVMWEDTDPATRKNSQKLTVISSFGTNIMFGVGGTDLFWLAGGYIFYSTDYAPTAAAVKANQSFQSNHEVFSVPPLMSTPLEPQTEQPLGWVGSVGGSNTLGSNAFPINIGGKYNGQAYSAVTGTIGYTPGSVTTTVTPDYYLIGDVYCGADFNYFAYCAVGGSSFTTPRGMNSSGKHAWVIKGNPTQIANTLTPARTVPIDNVATYATDDEVGSAAGCWTGVDLETLEVDDFIMVAVDTRKGNIWFGKNGFWYDQSGKTQHTPGDNILQPAATLDAGKYHPAAGGRWGTMTLKLRFGTSVHYIPPGGFSAYDLVSNTIPGVLP